MQQLTDSPLIRPSDDKTLGAILVVDDDPSIRELLRKWLEAEGFRVEVTDSLEGMKKGLRRYFFDAVLLDVYLGDENGMDGLPFIIKECPLTKVIVMTAHQSVDLAVDAMERGALTFVPKTAGAKAVVDHVKKKLVPFVNDDDDTDTSSFEQQIGIIGQSTAIRRVLSQIKKVKDVDSTVLITGETGTGKELVARALHRLSVRSGGRFEAINCNAIPENLLESELFGHKRGAFTDAKTDREGLFQVCSDGTLFLDEIGDMPIALQPKVLRALQEREVRPLGSVKSVTVNTRIVAATHKNLKEAIKTGEFREDLYYRLSVLVIELPPLRERAEDVPLLVEHFIKRFNKRFGKAVRVPPASVMTRLKVYSWPGNIRELGNAIERAVILSKDDELHLEDIISNHQPKTSVRSPEFGLGEAPLSLGEAREKFEKEYVTWLLKVAEGNISEAARIAGKHRADIYRLIDRYQIDQNQFR